MNKLFSTIPAVRWPRLVARVCVLISFLALLSAPCVRAADSPPDRMSYQGFLVDGNGIPLATNGPVNYGVVFRIYGVSTEGTSLWTEQQVVTVDNGAFSVVLGEGNPVSGEPGPQPTNFLSSVFRGNNASERYMGITVTIGNDALTLLPRLRLLPAPYAFMASHANTATQAAKANAIVDANGNEIFGANSGNVSVTGDGRVGIGTGTPSSRLTIASPTPYDGSLLKFYSRINESSDAAYSLTLNSSASDAVVKYSFDLTNNGASFPNNLVLDRGRVGIGTAAPVLGSKLHTFDSGPPGEYWQGMGAFGNSNYAAIAGVYNDVPIIGAHSLANGAFSGWAPLHINTSFGTGGAHVVVSKLGVGMKSPDYLLDVADRIKSRTGSGSGGLMMANAAGEDRAFVGLYDESAASVRAGMWVNDAWRMLIDQSGNMGVGTVTPRAKLDVVDSTTTGGWLALVAKGNGGTDAVVLGTLAGKATIGGHNAAMTTFTDLLINPDAGKVGIGTRTPEAPLHVAGSAPSTFTLEAYMDYQNIEVHNWNQLNRTLSHSIVAESRIKAAAYDIPSDLRIKTNIVQVRPNAALALINSLQVKDYRFIDAIGKGSALQRGFIAQELETLMPEAICRSEEVVPNIFSLADKCEFSASTKELEISLLRNHELEEGDTVRLITRSAPIETKVLKVLSQTSFVVQSERDLEQLFVYGKKVKDFRTIDYDRVFTTGISAIQELSQQVENLKRSEARLADLEQKAARIDSLDAEVATLKRLVTRLAQNEMGEKPRAEAPSSSKSAESLASR